MKNIMKNICLVLVFVIAGTLTGNAQVSTEGAKGAKDLQKKKEEVKEVVTQDMKNDQEGMKGRKDKMKEEKRELKDQMKEDKRELKDQMKDDKRELKEEMKDAKGEMKERMKEGKSELKEEMKDAKDAMKDKMKDEKRGYSEEEAEGINTGGAVDQQTVISATDGIEGSQAESKKFKGLKGKELGQARASDAKKMIESKENQMAGRDAHVVKSRTKIEGAKKSLAAQIAAGSLSKEQIDAKQNSIDNAERSLKAYEDRLAAAKDKYSDQKIKVSELYKEN